MQKFFQIIQNAKIFSNNTECKKEKSTPTSIENIPKLANKLIFSTEVKIMQNTLENFKSLTQRHTESGS